MQMRDSLNKVLVGLDIKAECTDASRHRHIGIYDVKLAPSERVRSIESRATEIALHLNSRCEPLIKPITEKGIVRIQSIISKPETINFEELYKRATSTIGVLKGFMPFLIGETYEGEPLWVDMAEHPHTLVAGETGSGKSVCLHLMIANAAKRNDVKMFLIDPKRVEFGRYSNEKYKGLVKHIANDYTSAIGLLKQMVSDMETRYNIMASMGISSIREMPNLFDKYVIIIDEAADLMMQQDKRDKEFETLLIRLAQKSRAAGIYLILATQRPSVDIITGLIKANFPARIAFKVSSKSNSRVIIDTNGAEALVGRGDGIIKSSVHDFVRFQGAFIE